MRVIEGGTERQNEEENGEWRTMQKGKVCSIQLNTDADGVLIRVHKSYILHTIMDWQL